MDGYKKAIMDSLHEIRTNVSDVKSEQTEIKKDLEHHIKRTDLLETSMDRNDLFYRWFIPLIVTLGTIGLGALAIFKS